MRLFLHCASSYNIHLHVGVQVGPKGDEMWQSSPPYAAVQGCTPDHCSALKSTGVEPIPLALQGRSITVETKGGWQLWSDGSSQYPHRFGVTH